MNLDKGFYNAEKRRDTALERINDRYYVAIVPSGKYAKGDMFKETPKG